MQQGIWCGAIAVAATGTGHRSISHRGSPKESRHFDRTLVKIGAETLKAQPTYDKPTTKNVALDSPDPLTLVANCASKLKAVLWKAEARLNRLRSLRNKILKHVFVVNEEAIAVRKRLDFKFLFALEPVYKFMAKPLR